MPPSPPISASASPGVWPSLKSKRTALPSSVDCGRSSELEPPALAQQRGELGDVRRTVARMRRAGACPGRFADDVAGARKLQLGRPRLVERAEQAACMVEVQVAQHDGVDVFLV